MTWHVADFLLHHSTDNFIFTLKLKVPVWQPWRYRHRLPYKRQSFGRSGVNWQPLAVVPSESPETFLQSPHSPQAVPTNDWAQWGHLFWAILGTKAWQDFSWWAIFKAFHRPGWGFLRATLCLRFCLSYSFFPLLLSLGSNPHHLLKALPASSSFLSPNPSQLLLSNISLACLIPSWNLLLSELELTLPTMNSCRDWAREGIHPCMLQSYQHLWKRQKCSISYNTKIYQESNMNQIMVSHSSNS